MMVVPAHWHLKWWIVETSADGECHFIRLVNIGKSHIADDRFKISAWEIFGSLLESTANSSDVDCIRLSSIRREGILADGALYCWEDVRITEMRPAARLHSGSSVASSMP
jgi:hypothetical protein